MTQFVKNNENNNRDRFFGVKNNGQNYTPAPDNIVNRKYSGNKGRINSKDIWDTSLSFMEFALDIIKSIMVVMGVISANLLDVVLGGISITILFGGSNTDLIGIPAWALGTAFSMGASAIQIFLWTLLIRRGISFEQLLNFNRIPKDIKLFLPAAILVWLVDTAMDVAPIFLLIQNSQYQVMPYLYYTVVGCAVVLVVLLCGFAEPLTANMKNILTNK